MNNWYHISQCYVQTHTYTNLRVFLFKIAKCSSAAMSNCFKYYANPWIILKPQFKPEEEQEMDTGFYWKMTLYYARIYCIHSIWENCLTNYFFLHLRKCFHHSRPPHSPKQCPSLSLWRYDPQTFTAFKDNSLQF